MVHDVYVPSIVKCFHYRNVFRCLKHKCWKPLPCKIISLSPVASGEHPGSLWQPKRKTMELIQLTHHWKHNHFWWLWWVGNASISPSSLLNEMFYYAHTPFWNVPNYKLFWEDEDWLRVFETHLILGTRNILAKNPALCVYYNPFMYQLLNFCGQQFSTHGSWVIFSQLAFS